MHKDYSYTFNRNKCWYLGKCEYENNPNICRISCQRYFKMDYLMYCSNIPPKRQGFEALTPQPKDLKVFSRLFEIQKNLVNWVEEGNNLYLYSTGFGNGKTSWALKLLKNYFNLIWPTSDFVARGIFISLPLFIRNYKEQIKNPSDSFDFLCHNLTKVDLVVWDDLGCTSLTDADFKLITSYIEDRYLQKLSNIFTGNLNEEQLRNLVGDRLTERIWRMSERLEFKGKSLRGRN